MENIQPSNKSRWFELFFKGLVQLLSIPMVLACLVIIYELSVEPENSLWVKVQERLAVGEKVTIETKAATEAWKEQLFQLSVAEIERVNIAYQNLWQANSQIMVIAYQMDDKVLQSQIELVKSTYTMDSVGVNIGSAACLVGSFLGDPTLKSGCDFAEEQRVKMARDIQQITQQHRTSIPDDIFSSLPSPDDMKVDKQKLRKLMEGIDHD
jgi:hypothetical protein